MTKPYYIEHEGEQIRCTLSKLIKDSHNNVPLKAVLQRYIVGRPNLLRMPLMMVQEEVSEHYAAGAHIEFLIEEVDVWCYSDYYPARFDIDCQNLTLNTPYRLGDLSLTLPYGMYLH